MQDKTAKLNTLEDDELMVVAALIIVHPIEPNEDEIADLIARYELAEMSRGDLIELCGG